MSGRGDKLAGRTAVVTGASRGIGAAIAEALAHSGARVALVARSGSVIDDLARRLGNDAAAVEADLSVEAEARAAATKVGEIFGGPPDIIVNNAGIFRIVELEHMDPREFGTMLRLNLFAPFVVLRAFLQAMRARGSGHVVTIGSVADHAIFAGNAGYSATKFGIRAMHEVLREETRGSGVKATLVSPAGVDTDVWDSIQFVGEDAPSPNRAAMMSPAAVADAVLYALTQGPDVNVDEIRISRS